ncbi:high-potential iron-sulfur protein [Pelomonas cellulosilytica]|uniref:High-potential iron-sulfur protein n=1 Tax=Pelomonas cellulosilytica TaxID=2906762 RepID=A0ABS8XP60_9BURK|nr:high-potential iron-sulfur protein [Pelomonas sp. P8]MCE4553447.1 high-potential iron-sulfur protein [Pelomonas sp. P8]
MASITRRRLVQALPLLGTGLAAAQEQSLLQESDDEAKATGYHADATRVNKARFPTYVPGQTCANCKLYAPDGDKPSGGCALFYGKDVMAKGWCKAWVKPD